MIRVKRRDFLITPFLKYVPQETVVRVNDFKLLVGRRGVQLSGDDDEPEYHITCSSETLPDGILSGLKNGQINIYRNKQNITSKIVTLFQFFSP